MCDEIESRLQPHVLLLASQRWPTGARLGLALRVAGFRVSLWSPHGHPLQLTDALHSHYAFSAMDTLATLASAIESAAPDLLVPCDDLATHYLQRLTTRALSGGHPASLLTLIERSLGPAGDLAHLTERAHVLGIATAAGLPVPATAQLHSAAELRQWFATHGFPAYLKADGSSGGLGVRPVHDYEEAEQAFRLLHAPPRASRALKRFAIDHDTTLLGPLLRRQRPVLSAQRAVSGTEANSAIFCWQGRVLAGISVQVLATCYDRGPSTVLRRIQHSGMDQTAEVLAEQLHLSGFFGLDFILDEQTGTPWLLEMNSRATQIAHMALGPGHDLATAAFSALTGVERSSRPLLTSKDTIALFPQEWQRDPSSLLLQTAYHDVPWESPGLVRAFLKQGQGWRSRMTYQHWRKRRVGRQFASATAHHATASRVH